MSLGVESLSIEYWVSRLIAAKSIKDIFSFEYVRNKYLRDNGAEDLLVMNEIMLKKGQWNGTLGTRGPQICTWQSPQ